MDSKIWILYGKIMLKEVVFLQASLYSAGIFTKNFLVVNRKIIFCGEMVQVFVWWEMWKSRKFLLPKTTILEEKNE